MATTLSPPTSQQHRPVSFRLDGRAAGYGVSWFHLPIRPEDLTRNSPTRAAVHQTLSANNVIGWADSFGEGLPELTIAGHTGWHRNASTGLDGEEAFKQLYAEVYKNWNQYRQKAINDGKDPNRIKLTFVDDLDGFAYLVIPIDFTLRRSRSNALLLRYNIRMQSISTLPEVPHQPVSPSSIGPPTTAASKSLSPSSIASDARRGMTALEHVIHTVEHWVSEVQAKFETYVADVAKPVHEFMNMTQKALVTAQSAETKVLQDFASADAEKVRIAQDLSQSARNIFWTINGVRNLPQEVMHMSSQVASAYNNAFCLFRNVLASRSTYPVYNPLYGASNCSSTAGGSAISQYSATGVNTFEAVSPTQSGFQISTGASSAIASFKNVDPVLHPMSLHEMGHLMNNVTSGIKGFL